MSNITVRQIEIESSNGRGMVRGWIYEPDTAPLAMVQICHGMQEHMGRYHDFMHFLAKNGYAACGIDQIGHGASDMGSRGFFAEHDGWRMLIKDQRRFYRAIREQFPSCPAVLLGHSMGSFISRIYVSRFKQDFDGLILSGTARSGLRIEAAIQAADLSARRHGANYHEDKIQRIVQCVFNKRVPDSDTPDGWLSRDASRVHEFSSDAMCQFTFTASAFRDLFILLRKANERKSFEDIRAGLPVLIFSGTMDSVGEYGKGTRQVYERYGKLSAAMVELRMYENGRHEMLNETNRAQVYGDIINWLGAHIVRAPQTGF